MGVFNLFPFTNFQEKNLDWIIKKLKEMDIYIHDTLIEEIHSIIEGYYIEVSYDEASRTITLKPEDNENG